MADYQTWLAKRLSQVYQFNSIQQARELDRLQLVLFSDLHKGRRDGADDFMQCEAVYLAALDYYWANGFELCLLGDVEELWECRPQQVVAAYANVFQSEQRFAREPARYLRVVGNHDDLWYKPSEVAKHLGKFLGSAVVVEGARLRIEQAEQVLGELFLVHGHQGTLLSDRYRGLSQWVVRTIWRPIQRLLRFKTTTPANDFELKKQHELAMYTWAASGTGRVMVAGHTHHPVWAGLSYQQALARQPVAAGAWIAANVGGQIELPGEKPAYFNTGCCSFSDGSITGLEIAEGQIRLVRWENPAGPVRIPLFSADLAAVLKAVAAG